jgi:hypothetical protein
MLVISYLGGAGGLIHVGDPANEVKAMRGPNLPHGLSCWIAPFRSHDT